MKDWFDTREGNTKHCCLCIPTNVGAHILGFFATLSTIMSVVFAIGTISTDAAGTYLLYALLSGYPAAMYLLMVMDNNK